VNQTLAGLYAASSAFAALVAIGCGPSLASVSDVMGAPGKTSAKQAELHDLARREHLLFRPHGNPEELLGRSVTRAADGSFAIASELPAGCVVRTKRTPERWRRTYVEELRRVAGAGADFGEIAELKARYGSEARVRVEVENTERLDADLEGECGEGVITMVRVGTGSRFIGTKTQKEGAAGVTVMGVGTTADASEARDQAVSFSWSEPQAWVFEVGHGSRGRRMELNAAMPTELSDGQHYRVTVLPNRAVWLIAYYREEDGRVGKLLPNMENPVIAVAPNERRELPELQVGLNDPAKAAREWFVVCGFDDPAFVQKFEPPKGDPSPEQMQAWHKELPALLETIGRRHYQCEEIGYRIVPAPTAERR
jgi:hypothetical protein